MKPARCALDAEHNFGNRVSPPSRRHGMTPKTHTAPLTGADSFVVRHIGPAEADVAAILARIGHESLDDLIDATIPKAIRMKQPLAIHAGLSEHEALASLRAISLRNRVN